MLSKISRRLWYLSKESVALALCDNGVPIAEKRRMLLAMNTVYNDEKPKARQENQDWFGNTAWKGFTSQKHRDVFEKLNLQTEFLELSID